MNLWNRQLTQNSNWKIWRISALASKKRSIKKVKAPSCLKKWIKIKIFFFWFDLVLEARVEILQIFQLLFWRIDDFINSFRLNLTFTKSILAKLTTSLWIIPGLEETCYLGRPWGHRLLRKTTVADESPQGEKTLSRMMKELKMPWL